MFLHLHKGQREIGAAEGRPGRQGLSALSLWDLSSVTIKCWNGTNTKAGDAFLLTSQNCEPVTTESVKYWLTSISFVMEKRGFSDHQRSGRRPGEHKTILYPVSSGKLAPEDWPALKHRTFSTLGSLGKGLSTGEGVYCYSALARGNSQERLEVTWPGRQPAQNVLCSRWLDGMRAVPKPVELSFSKRGRPTHPTVNSIDASAKKIWVDMSWLSLLNEEICKMSPYSFFFKHCNSPSITSSLLPSNITSSLCGRNLDSKR